METSFLSRLQGSLTVVVQLLMQSRNLTYNGVCVYVFIIHPFNHISYIERCSLEGMLMITLNIKNPLCLISVFKKCLHLLQTITMDL